MSVYFRIFAGAAMLFLTLAAQALCLWSKCRLRFELAVPICLMSDMFVLLFSGLLVSDLRIGVYLIFMLSLGGFLASVYRERKNLRTFFRTFFSVGFLVFAIGYLLCWLVSIPQTPHAWDDYGHWFPFVKQMVAYDKLYSDPSVYLMKQWFYTPAISLLQYLFCRMVGGFSECACYTVGTLLMFVSVLPILKWFEGKSVKVRLFSVITLFLSLYVTAREDLDGFFLGFRSSYVDIHLAAVTALLICWILFERESFGKTLCIGVISAFLTMIKVTGIMFALLGTGTYVLILSMRLLLERKMQKEGRGAGGKDCLQKKQLAMAFLPIAALVLIYMAWNRQTYLDIEFGSLSGMNADGFLLTVNKFGQGLTSRSFSLTWEWMRTYFYYFFTKIINEGATLHLTASVFLILFWIALFIKIRIHSKEYWMVNQFAVTGICVTGGLFVYNMAIGLAFYSIAENLDTMTSYKRYLSSYVGTIVALLFVLVLHVLIFDLQLDKKRECFAACSIFAILIVILPVDFWSAVLGTSETAAYKGYYSAMQVWGENLRASLKKSSTEDARVFLVKSGHGGPDTPSLPADVSMPGYFMLPIALQDYGQYRYDPDSALPFYTCEEWGDLLADQEFSNVVLANYAIPALGWQKPYTGNLARMYSLFDVPPEELEYDAPLLFRIDIDSDGKLHLAHVVVETPIQ